MQTLPLSLPAGSDLRMSIEKLGRLQKKEGFILGVVGNLSKAAFQCPGREKPTLLEGNLEIITLNGTFSENGVHLHLSISDGDCQVWGGHLEPGTVVLKGADILLGITESHSNDNHSTNRKNHLNPRLEIAILPTCPWSARALRLLRTLDIPHQIHTISNDNDFNLFKERSGVTTFPQVFIDNKFIGGYQTLTDMHASGNLNNL